MIEYLMAGGGLMIPIVLCSIVAAGITLERLWSLRSQEVNPQSRLAAIHRRIDLGDVTDEWLDELLERSPLERLSAQVLQVRHGGKSVMQDLLFVEVKQIAHELERYLSTLGSMAAITPLLGLLGTVIGMIKVFSAIQAAGLGEASLLAGGISEALVTTAAGLGVAIPALVMHRFLSRRVDELLIDHRNVSFLHALTSYISAVVMQTALCRLVQPGHQAHEGGFPRQGPAKQNVKGTCLKSQIGVPDVVHAINFSGDILQYQGHIFSFLFLLKRKPGRVTRSGHSISKHVRQRTYQNCHKTRH